MRKTRPDTMKVTFQRIVEKFKEYNQSYFGGELPLPRFRVLNTYSMLGRFFCYRITGNRRLRGQRIDVSCYYDLSEAEFRDVLVHEMIHYYLAYKHIDNGLTHGEAFLKACRTFNQQYGMNIKVKARRNEYKRSEDAPLMPWVLHVIGSYIMFWDK